MQIPLRNFEFLTTKLHTVITTRLVSQENDCEKSKTCRLFVAKLYAFTVFQVFKPGEVWIQDNSTMAYRYGQKAPSCDSLNIEHFPAWIMTLLTQPASRIGTRAYSRNLEKLMDFWNVFFFLLSLKWNIVLSSYTICKYCHDDANHLMKPSENLNF